MNEGAAARCHRVVTRQNNTVRRILLWGHYSNDAILFFAFLYSSSDIFVEWDAFESCRRPIQYWLVVSYASIVAFRLSHYLGQCLSDLAVSLLLGACTGGCTGCLFLNILAYIIRHSMALKSRYTVVINILDGEDFILYRQRGPPFWVNVLILGILFPFFFCWTIVGTVWFAQVEASTPQCLPRGSHPWFFVFWLVLCYVWIVIYILFVAVAATFEFRARRAERDLQLLQNEDMLRRWGRLGVFAQYGIHIIRRGLTTEQIQRLACEKLSAIPLDQPSCSICLEDYCCGDEVRLLQACGHIFHKSCIDIWLLRNAVCPNCKGSIYSSAAVLPKSDASACNVVDASEAAPLIGGGEAASSSSSAVTTQEEDDQLGGFATTTTTTALDCCVPRSTPPSHPSAFASPGVAEHLLPQNCV